MILVRPSHSSEGVSISSEEIGCLVPRDITLSSMTAGYRVLVLLTSVIFTREIVIFRFSLIIFYFGIGDLLGELGVC